jgi:hypothetical protein
MMILMSPQRCRTKEGLMMRDHRIKAEMEATQSINKTIMDSLRKASMKREAKSTMECFLLFILNSQCLMRRRRKRRTRIRRKLRRRRAPRTKNPLSPGQEVNTVKMQFRQKESWMKVCTQTDTFITSSRKKMMISTRVRISS